MSPRGRRTITRPAIVPEAYQKSECLSIDTFWWRTPKEALKPGENPKHIIGLSMMDEATDFQTAVIIRMGNEPLRNISADEFQKSLSRGWLQHFPAPSILRYDEDGFLRSWDKIPWLETFGMKLEPIAAESAWQGGKHSKHLQTLKEQLNLLCMEIGDSFGLEQLLALAVSAKNNMHNIRGYSPNQWAFGQNHSRISSFLENTNNLPHQAARNQPT